MKHTVFFEIFGKKMKVVVEAESIVDARCIVRERIKFHKIIPEPKQEKDNVGEFFENMFTWLNSKPPFPL